MNVDKRLEELLAITRRKLEEDKIESQKENENIKEEIRKIENETNEIIERNIKLLKKIEEIKKEKGLGTGVMIYG